MLSKRSIIYLLFLSMSFIVACTASDILPTPPPTPTNTPKPNTPKNWDILVPHNCHQNSVQTYIAMEGNYCFAYPSGYYVKPGSVAENIELRYYSAPPNTENLTIDEIDALQGSGTFNSSMVIVYETNKEEPPLEQFENKHKEEQGYTTDVVSITIGGQDALLRTETIIKKNGDLDTKAIWYIVYVKDGKKYYRIEFHTDALFGEQTASSREVERFFFMVLDTFTFIH